jgi:glycosyltransferase involved in cell wall biosynthesis
LDIEPVFRAYQNEVMTSLSFIICSWQAPMSLDETLDSIAKQMPSDGVEIILVNNGFSTVRASELQQRHPALRMVNESTPGLAHARRAGFRAARGEFFICLDDDNLIGGNFIDALTGLTARHPNLGCISSVVVPLWEQQPEPWLQEFGKSCLSYNSLQVPEAGAVPQEQIWEASNLQGWPAPPGGGMIIHRSLAEDYLRENDERRLKLDRVGNNLGGSGDQDIIYRIHDLGLGAAWSSRLLIFHKIPASRIRMAYLLKLNFRMSQDAGLFEHLRWKKNPAPGGLANHRALLFWRFLAWVRGRIPARQLLLEWARSTGFILGWLKWTNSGG